MYKPNMPDQTHRRIKTKPSITLFDLDKNGVPYLDYDYSRNLVARTVRTKTPWLLLQYDMEDLISEVLIKMCSSTYDPTKSAPKTYAILLINSKLGTISKEMSAVRRTAYTDQDGINRPALHVSISPRIDQDEYGDALCGIDQGNPETSYIVSEMIRECTTNGSVPDGYRNEHNLAPEQQRLKKNAYLKEYHRKKRALQKAKTKN